MRVFFFLCVCVPIKPCVLSIYPMKRRLPRAAPRAVRPRAAPPALGKHPSCSHLHLPPAKKPRHADREQELDAREERLCVLERSLLARTRELELRENQLRAWYQQVLRAQRDIECGTPAWVRAR